MGELWIIDHGKLHSELTNLVKEYEREITLANHQRKSRKLTESEYERLASRMRAKISAIGDVYMLIDDTLTNKEVRK